MIRSKSCRLAGFALLGVLLGSGGVAAQSPLPGVDGYEVEWVYRVR